MLESKIKKRIPPLRNSSCLLLTLLFLSSCGREITNSASGSQAQDSQKSLSSETLYNQLPSPDMGVNSNSFTGVFREQRESSTHLCRRFQNAGTTSFSFVCYQSVSSGSQAQSSFNALTNSYGSYSVSIGNFIGSAFIDEITNGSMYGGGTVLCQKVSPQNPSAPSSYRCFQKL